MGFLLRWFMAFFLLVATFNPTPWNYSVWAWNNLATETPLAVFLGLLLCVGYIIFLRATLRSIGGIGMLLVLSIFLALIWVLTDYGLLRLDNQANNTWIGLIALSLVLGIGLSWSHVRRALSGQTDVDDVED